MLKFIVNVFVDLIVAYMSTLFGAMIYYTVSENATQYEGHVLFQFIITLIALRFYRVISFFANRHGQSE